MGVPSFYRWLVNKYPKIRVSAIEAKGDDVDTSTPNPNGIEFDNFYLDMNGIIHPCFHPEDQSLAPATYDDVFNRIFAYIDHLFSIVRPRKLLYMAIDGVAPRAKMNQQRSRRFRTAMEYEISVAEEDRLRMEFEMEGKPVLPKEECEVSDSNVITPGTEFMDNLSKMLKGYIVSRLCEDTGWKGIQVVLSEANVPGEGEHKIMAFIRYQTSIPGYNVNTRHCLYGLDADLIMLALATHEIHFSILRDDVLVQEQQPVFQPVKSRGWFKDVKTDGDCLEDSNAVNRYSPIAKRPYEFLHVWILREYLELDMNIAEAEAPEKFRFDLERIIDDFIFMCFFAGNDFLPHMPTLAIHEGGIDLLMNVYKKQFKHIGGYLVDMQKAQDKKGACVKLKRVEKFLLSVSTYEEAIFKKRSELLEHRLRKLSLDSGMQQEEHNEISENSASSYPGERMVSLSAEVCASGAKFKNSSADKYELLRNTKDLKEKLKKNLREKSDLFKNGGLGSDKVKLGTPGWKNRYYKLKFSAETSQEIEIIRKEIVQKYTEGLLWVLLYYFFGVPSWSWFYPFHYGPFASDLKGLSQGKVKFQKGHPFKPFDQLMSVLPPRSAHALPIPYSKLITDKDSKISDFYPNDFETDTEGKRFAWQGICKLPFIDEERLVAETRRLEQELTQEESRRNAKSSDQLFVTTSNNSGTEIWKLFPKVSANEKLMMTGDSSGTIGGLNDCGCNFTSPPTILSLLFEQPDGSLHIPRPLEGVEYPDKTITVNDIQVTSHLWHEYPGSRPPYNKRPESQTTFMKASCSKLPSASRSACVIQKGGGTGWGAGRGIAACNNNMTKSVANLTISESSQTMGSYGRGQTTTSSLWSSGNHASTQSSNHSWRQGSQANRIPYSPSLGRGQWDSKTGGNSAWPLNTSNAARGGRGRSQFIPSTSTDTSRSAGVMQKGGGTGWGAGRGIAACNNNMTKSVANLTISESSQTMGSYGRGQTTTSSLWSSGNHASTQSSNHSWRQGSQANRIPYSPSLGRGQWDSKTGGNSAWPLNTSNAARGGRGRSQFIPSTSTDTSRRFP